MRSYLDEADLASLRRAGEAGGPAALALACLLEGGVAEFDPDEPEWSDRDRVLVDPALPLQAVAAVLERAGYPADDGRMGQGAGRVLAEAVRAARASQAAGDVYRVFAVLDGASLDSGAVWEALREAAADTLTPLTALLLDAPAHVPAAAGWRVEEVPAGPAEVLSGLDRLLLPGAAGPGALVVRSR